MKKILMLLLVFFGFIFIPEVKAQEYKLKKYDQEGIYFVRKGGTVPDKNGTFAIYYLGDYLAYCIDPSKSIRTEDYVSSDGYVDLPYSNDVKEKIKLYGYYGREYPGHDNVRYSMAAQSLIWEIAGGQKVSFWTGKNGTGEEIDVTKEKNEIKNLVEKHHIIPNLPNEVYTDVLHETIIEDKNNILDNFKVVEEPYFDTYIKNNKLHVIPKKQGLYTMRLQRKSYDDTDTIIFVGKNGTDTQTLGRLRFSDLNEQEITISVDGAHLFIHKIDENGNKVKIPSINFKIKNLSTGEYLCDRYDCIFETDPTGLIVTNGVDFGDYEIEELEDQIINGYSWNSEKVIVSVTEDNVKWDKDKLSYVEATFKNKSVSASLELYKVGEKVVFENNSINYQEIKIENIVFDLYDSNNNFIKKIVTDKNGYAKVDNLSVGKYYLQEKTNDSKYIPNNEKINFELKQDNSHQEHVNYKLTVKNHLKKGGLELYKKGEDYKFIDNEISYETTELANVTFELYNDEKELVKTIKTNDDGYVKVENLPIGKYYLIEKNTLNNYIKDEEKHIFEIKNNGENIKLEINNYLKKGNLEFSKVDLKTGDGIPNTIIEIYSDDNEILFTKETDESGKVNISNLPVGKYYIIEKEANSMYQLTNEKVYFEIKDNDELIKTKMTNEKITIPVPKTNTKEGIIAHTIFGICIIVGLGGLYFERKEIT